MYFFHFLTIEGIYKAKTKGSGVQPFHMRNPFHSASIYLETIQYVHKGGFRLVDS